MSNDLQVEVDRLVSIAHLHALNALSQPESQRDSHLDVCRGFWKHYAAAFTVDEGQCDAFVDALDHATRDLIAELQQETTRVHMSGVPRLGDDGAQAQAGPSSAMTLEELRPIFRKIIEQ
jgi:type IV secretory pathway VirJ component